MPKKFENVVFTLKKHQMFYHHTTPEKFENGIFTLKTHQTFSFYKAGVFKFLRFEKRLREAPFSGQISVDGRPNRRNKAAFSNSSGLKSV